MIHPSRPEGDAPAMLWVFITVAALGLFWFGYRKPYRRRWLLPRQVVPQTALSPVDRQHKHLAAGGQLAQGAVEQAAKRFRELLQSGRTRELEGELQPGTDYAVKVRALTLIGTAEATRVLERQLTRYLSSDAVEQAWYLADIAAGLRLLQCAPALPAVLRCADAALGLPPGLNLATEAIAFPNFTQALSSPSDPIRQAALRVVSTVLRRTRDGILDPSTLLRADLAKPLAALSLNVTFAADPWFISALVETERLHRRIRWWSRFFSAELATSAALLAQELARTLELRREQLNRATRQLVQRFAVASVDEQTAILRCLHDLRVDATELFPHFPDRHARWWAEAIRCLTWSRSAVIGSILTSQALRGLRAYPPWRSAVLLSALRGHSSPQTERVLLQAGLHRDSRVREQAARSLGWSVPFDPGGVIALLRKLRYDSCKTVQAAATGGLARLGERSALQELLNGLHSEEGGIRVASADRIAAEEVSWLWPELQELALDDDSATALAASEAVEVLRECVLGLTR